MFLKLHYHHSKLHILGCIQMVQSEQKLKGIFLFLFTLNLNEMQLFILRSPFLVRTHPSGREACETEYSLLWPRDSFKGYYTAKRIRIQMALILLKNVISKV